MRISNNSHEIHVYKLGGMTFVIPPGISVTTSDGGVVIAQFDVDVETSYDDKPLCAFSWTVATGGGRMLTTCVKVTGHQGGHVDDSGNGWTQDVQPTQSKQCCFYWVHQHKWRGQSSSTCAFGIKGTVTNTRTCAGNRPTQAEHDAGKEDDAADV